MDEKFKEEIIELLDKISDLIRQFRNFIEETDLEELNIADSIKLFVGINSLFHALNQVEGKIKEIQRILGLELLKRGIKKIFGEDIDIN